MSDGNIIDINSLLTCVVATLEPLRLAEIHRLIGCIMLIFVVFVGRGTMR